MTQTWTERQIADARMDLQIAVEHYVDASINVQQERYDDARDKYASSERRRGHATRVLGTTIDEFDALFIDALHARMRDYPAVYAMFPPHQERATMTTEEEKEHAELEPTHAPTCECDECEQTYIEPARTDDDEIPSRATCMYCRKRTLDRCMQCGRFMCRECVREDTCSDCEWREYVRTAAHQESATMTETCRFCDSPLTRGEAGVCTRCYRSRDRRQFFAQNLTSQERATMSSPEEQEHAEQEPVHAPGCECEPVDDEPDFTEPEDDGISDSPYAEVTQTWTGPDTGFAYHTSDGERFCNADDAATHAGAMVGAPTCDCDACADTRTYNVRTFDAVFDRTSDTLVTSLAAAEDLAIELVHEGHAHTFIVCEHAHVGNCPHGCHRETVVNWMPKQEILNAIDTHDDRTRSASRVHWRAPANTLVLGAALALALLSGHASAQELRPGTSVIIHGSDCQVNHAWEDGSAIAHCRDHTVWAFDPDGNALYGIAPGTWVRQKHTSKGAYGR